MLGTNYDERILPSIMNESAKAIVARYNANELLTKRDQVSREVSIDLQKRAAKFNVILDDVAITHLSFSPEYARAVEAKQVGKFFLYYEQECHVSDSLTSKRNCILKTSSFVPSFFSATNSPTGCGEGQVCRFGSPTGKEDYYYPSKRRSGIRRTYWFGCKEKSWVYEIATNRRGT